MSHPGTSRCQTPGHVQNRRVRDAEEDDVRVVLAHGDAPPAQAGGDGRTNTARSDDVDCFDHDRAPAPMRMPGTSDSTPAWPWRTLRATACSLHACVRDPAGRLRR